MRLFQPMKQSYYYGLRGGFALYSALLRLPMKNRYRFTAAEGLFLYL